MTAEVRPPHLEAAAVVQVAVAVQVAAVVQAAEVVAVLAVKAADPAHQVSRARCHNYEWQLIVGIMRKK